MNKMTINQEMQQAYEALKEAGVVNDKGEIAKAFRGQISSFGAAVTMGSLLPAIAFFSNQGGAGVERERLMQAILIVLQKRAVATKDEKSLYAYARKAVDAGSEEECKEEILNTTIALKLAMNLYKLTTN